MKILKEILLLDRCSLVANNIENSVVPSSDHNCFINALSSLSSVKNNESFATGFSGSRLCLFNYLSFASLKFGCNCEVKVQAWSRRPGKNPDPMEMCCLPLWVSPQNFLITYSSEITAVV